jgi:UDP-N-acetylglucosamine 2-epimerase (non-hydrolysing)
MIDSLLACMGRAEKSTVLAKLGLSGAENARGMRADVVPYAVLTLHRPGNVDSAPAFREILGGLKDVAARWPVIFPAHPRTQARIKQFGLGRVFRGGHKGRAAERQRGSEAPGLVMIPPLGYLDFLCLMKHAGLVVTDSGGIQEETTLLNVPCVTARENTERPVTVRLGTNVVAGTTSEGIRKAIAVHLRRRPRRRMPPKWDGKAASRIVSILARKIRERSGTAPSR